MPETEPVNISQYYSGCAIPCFLRIIRPLPPTNVRETVAGMIYCGLNPDFDLLPE